MSNRERGMGCNGAKGNIILVFVACVLASLTTIFMTSTNVPYFRDVMNNSILNFNPRQDDADDDVMQKEYKAAIQHEQKSSNGDEQDDDDVKPSLAKEKISLPQEKEEIQEDSQDDILDTRQMNVIVLFPDDWRWNSIGKENTLIKTPFLDSLADEGMRFRENAVTTSICWQSRATLFSGQWASRHQSYKLKCPHFARGTHWNHSWPAIMQRNGYYTGHIGKWQYHSNNDDRFDWSSYFEGKHVFRKNGKDIAAEDFAKNETIRFLRERPKDKPFAATVAFYPPKPVGNSNVPGGQWTPKKEVRAQYNDTVVPEPYNHTEAFKLLPEFLQHERTAARARWKFRYSTPHHYQEAMKNIYALITQVDQACREIVDEIKKQGLYNNTMIIFSTDNGMFHSAHGLAGKWYPYSESIKVPLIIYDPRMPKDKIGKVDDAFTLNVDLAETILGAAGLKPDKVMQGRDISDLYLPKIKKGKTILERKPWRDEFFYEFTFMNDAFIPSSNALVRRRWKLIDWYNHNQTQLFDLENDPLELKDVKNDPANVDIMNDMKKRLVEIRESLREKQKECGRGDYSPTSIDPDLLVVANITNVTKADR